VPQPAPALPPGVSVPRDPMQNYRPVAQRQMALQRRKLKRAHDGSGPRPSSIAFDASDRKKPLRGYLLDYRPGPTYATVLDPTVLATPTRLHVAAWQHNFSGCRNKRILSHVTFGIRFRDNLNPNHTMMAHNLHSLNETVSGLDNVVDSYHSLAAANMVALSTGTVPLTVPCRDNPAGATERKRLPGESAAPPPRLLIDEGHPHGAPTQELLTCGAKETVVSLNSAIGSVRHKKGDTNPQYWTECKPTAREAGAARATLGHGAALLNTTVNEVAFDQSKFFHQFALNNSEIWKTGTIVPDQLVGGGASDELVSSVYQVLAMGISMASNFAQEVADALMQRLLYLVGEAAAPLVARYERDYPAFAAHAAARRLIDDDAGGSQARLCDCVMYTDDSLKAVVGPEMMIIVLSCFHRLVGPAFNSYDVTELSRRR
jgi:hypothetical protein